MVLPAFLSFTAASIAAAQVYKNPMELSSLLNDGFQIVAVIKPPIVSPDQGFKGTDLERNQVANVQREIYLQKGSDARVCFHDIVRADAACYNLTAGESK
ncbi:MAG: hypothetical protein AAGH74_02895 [Pseudomonadota bacterium]